MIRIRLMTCIPSIMTCIASITAKAKHQEEPRVAAGGDDGDNNGMAAMTTGGDGFVPGRLNAAGIVDGVIADLPEPARHHILPVMEEYDQAWPAPCAET